LILHNVLNSIRISGINKKRCSYYKISLIMSFIALQDYIQRMLREELFKANEREKKRKTLRPDDWILHYGDIMVIKRLIGNMVETYDGKKINVKHLRKY